jgi:LDH2 family malate/lactate/ureidoglycolate dehydrogenase
VHLTISEARALATGALGRLGFGGDDAAVTADHLVDAALRGVTFGGLPRILAIAERLAEHGDTRRPIRVIHETPQSALLDGGDHVGYVVAHRATAIAVDKATRHGMAIVGANNTYYTGLFAYYVEMATRANLVGIAAGNASAMVAPHGAREALLGTNPIAFGFPSTGDPIIWDIGTSAIMQGEVMLHRRLGEPLPEGVALDKEGVPTRDPAAALAGALRTWGGHRGSGLAIVVQLLGIMCGTPAIPVDHKEMGFLFIAMSPTLLIPVERFKERAAELADAIRGAAPERGTDPVRMPFDRSARERRRQTHDGINVPDAVYQALVELRDSPRKGD